MSWRTVVVTRRSKLELQMNYIVVRNDTVVKIHLDEVYQLLVESTAVSITTSLLVELMKRKINVIFCDEKRLPCGELLGYYGSHNTSQKYKRQMQWTKKSKELVWTEIVEEKIRKQREHLLEIEKNKEAELLDNYVSEVEIGDASNREGHAAKVYFNALFGMDFTRTEDNFINAALNYGYSIILSAIAREIVSQGYCTQIGIFHDNMFNQFNLACDFMEPYRILIDRKVKKMKLDKFESEEKMQLVNVLNDFVSINGKNEYVSKSMKIYVKSIFDALDEVDISLISFYRI